MLDDETVAHLQHQAEQKRKHAAFFSWYDRSSDGKGLAEAGVVASLLEAMSHAGVSPYKNPRPSGEQWPDCWVETLNGTRIPFEVTELVDEGAMPAGVARPWPIHEVRGRIQALISGKDQRSQGGPGSRDVVLVIHTDEFYLDFQSVSPGLTGETFSLPYGNLARAFLLFSYHPTQGGYRFTELTLAA